MHVADIKNLPRPISGLVGVHPFLALQADCKNTTTAMEQIEAAERLLILSQFKDAEQSSTSFLSEHRLAAKELVSRAAAVYLQAVFEQER